MISVSKRAQLLSLLSLLAYLATAHQGFEEQEKKATEATAEETAEVAKQQKFFERLDGALKNEKGQRMDAMTLIMTYQTESIFILFFVICFAVLFIGKGQNVAVANQWHQASLPLIQSQFHLVGMTDGQQDTDFEKTAYSEFTFYASGRKNCFYALFKLDTLKRHCMLSHHVLERIYSSRDTLTVDIPVRPPSGDFEAAMHVPIEFFLCKKSRWRAAQDIHEHFKTFLYCCKADHLPLPKTPTNKKEAKEVAKIDNLLAYAEDDAFANQLIGREVGALLKQSEDALLELHITDQQVYNKYQCFMRARIAVGSTPEEMQHAVKALEAVFLILDKISRISISESVKNRCEKNRKKIEAVKKTEKAEIAEAEIAEKKRLEKAKLNAKLRSLPPEEAKKLEEKMRKAEETKQKKKMMKMVKH